MLNEEKVRLMTRLAIYENRDGKKMYRIAKYFRGDYVSWNVIKAGFAVTIAYIILLALSLVYKSEEMLEFINTIDIMSLGKKILLDYLVMIVVFVIISYIVYTLRYEKARKNLKRFHRSLRRLEQVGLDSSSKLDVTGGSKE